MNRAKITILTSLYNCADFLDAFLEHVSKLTHTELIEVLLLHNQPSEEELAIIQSKLDSLPFVKHIVIPERESLYKTWNRGAKIAQGEYLCIWNVDDIRIPDSVYDQYLTLEAHPEASLTYGDFCFMYKYGEYTDKYVDNTDFNVNRDTFFRAHHIGCFPMWRKNIHETLGYFDEQFLLVADFDFQIRLALHSKLVKTKSHLGYYLDDAPHKLSSNFKLQIKERTLLQLRYGMFDLLNWLYTPQILTYKIKFTKYQGTYLRLNIPTLFTLKRIPLLFISIFRQPRYVLAFIKHNILKR